jgi:hypothetical protein
LCAEKCHDVIVNVLFGSVLTPVVENLVNMRQKVHEAIDPFALLGQLQLVRHVVAG